VRRILIVAMLASASAAAEEATPWVEMKVWDVVRVEGDQSVVLLRGKAPKAVVLPIWIGEAEAVAIQLRLSRQLPPRPLTHDLLERVIETVGAKVVKIHVEALRERIFLGRVFVRQGTQTFDIDARPSDSIALALGAQAPIFVSRAVIAEAGMPAPEAGVPDDKRPANL
jgi:hypothetical protein